MEAKVQPDWMLEGSRQLATDAEALLKRHELEDHDGEICVPERVNMVAFLAHRIGYFNVPMFLDMLIEYQEIHDFQETNDFLESLEDHGHHNGGGNHD